jgi:hypothetical protein
MTKEEVVEQVCAIVAIAYHSIGNYESASDGFCNRCTRYASNETYRNDGKAIDYVREAVVNQLKKDGYKIHEGFDSITGKEKPPLKKGSES